MKDIDTCCGVARFSNSIGKQTFGNELTSAIVKKLLIKGILRFLSITVFFESNIIPIICTYITIYSDINVLLVDFLFNGRFP